MNHIDINSGLKNCPFCGENNVKVYSEDDDCFYAQCKCGICTVVCETQNEAINIWNRRV